ncbi:hypothetical protein IWQ62_004809 [Dispira parvispora]|uniref:Uncharacterized protein n=1 Tax=Dispira parvispora TaxID=1520584 RepID=A0A9W8ARY1_9FUNG|nr:hypothetical protein IWQ62_004809 [Dispira parvispora]
MLGNTTVLERHSLMKIEAACRHASVMSLFSSSWAWSRPVRIQPFSQLRRITLSNDPRRKALVFARVNYEVLFLGFRHCRYKSTKMGLNCPKNLFHERKQLQEERKRNPELSRKKQRMVRWDDATTERFLFTFLKARNRSIWVDWEALAKSFPDSTPLMLYQRWGRCLHNFRTGKLKLSELMAKDPELQTTNLEALVDLEEQSHALPPLPLQKQWSEEEVDLLNAAVNAYGPKDWNNVSQAVGTRTGLQCYQRWRRQKFKMNWERPWTPEEDQRLFEAVKQHGRKWRLFVKEFPDRVNLELFWRYERLTTPRMGKTWSREELERLKRGVAKYGFNAWDKVAQEVATRTSYQCSRRWHKGIPTGLRGRQWTAEEDAILIATAQQYSPWLLNDTRFAVSNRDPTGGDRSDEGSVPSSDGIDPDVSELGSILRSMQHAEEALAKDTPSGSLLAGKRSKRSPSIYTKDGQHRFFAVAASKLDRRTADHCYNRWKRLMKAMDTANQWSAEDCQRLVKLIAKYDNQWKTIRSELGKTRTAIEYRKVARIMEIQELLKYAPPQVLASAESGLGLAEGNRD